MDQLIFQELNMVERIRIMEDNAYKILDSYEYDRVLTEEEVADYEHEYTQTSIEITRLQEEKRRAMEELNENMKKKTKASEMMLEKIREGRERVVERVFVIEDDLNGTLGTYNAEGQLLKEQKASPGQQRGLKFNGGDGSKENPYVARVGGM